MKLRGCLILLCAFSALHATDWPELPEAISNNAFTALVGDDGLTLVSFAGIGSGLKSGDVHSRTYVLYPNAREWKRVADIPGKRGRLASVAVAVKSKAYVFGGYSVAADGSEISERDSYAFDPETATYRRIADMPIAVDDAVAVSYLNKYIYLVSGWHDIGNVNLVQRYDIQNDSWTQATPWPGSPVFGHAGALAGNRLLVCDGVRVSNAFLPRRFLASSECFLGTIDLADARRIHWQSAPPHPGGPCYRMSAAALSSQNQIIFVGGGDNPYNYNGVGYDGTPASPCARPQVFDLASGQWHSLAEIPAPRMDQRGLVVYRDKLLGVGGMSEAGQLESTVFEVEY
ncbi:MAG: galactose oxidase [Pseudomonadota bacterium]